MQSLDDYAAEWTRIGMADFAFIYGKPVLIGVGLHGDVSKGRGMSGSATCLALIPDSTLPSGESLVGRVWIIKKNQSGSVGQGVTLGRGMRNDIVIPEFSISRNQATFQCEPSKVLLVDLGSRNGTYANDTLLQPRKPFTLTSGDSLRFGRIRCTFLARSGFLECVGRLASMMNRT